MGVSEFMRLSAAVHNSKVNCDEMTDNAQTGTVKAVARLMNFAQITCSACR